MVQLSCCFPFGKKKAAKERNEPLLEREKSKEEEETKETPQEESTKPSKKSAPPPLSSPDKSQAEKKTPKKEGRKVAGSQQTPDGKSSKSPEKQSDSSKPSKGAKGGKDSKEEKSPQKDDDEADSPKSKGPPSNLIDASLKLKGRGGELPKPAPGTVNMNLSKKPSDQADTSGKTPKTVSRLKKANACIDSCRAELDLGTGKLS